MVPLKDTKSFCFQVWLELQAFESAVFQVKNLHAEKRTEVFSQLNCYTQKEKEYRQMIGNI